MTTNEPYHSTPPDLRTDAAHRAHLRKSGLSDDTIEKAGLYSVFDADAAARLLNRTATDPKLPLPALAFPYENSGGYVRLRVAGRSSDANDAPKYLAPSGTPSRLYIPTNVCPSILDPAVDLWLTEGEKKALAGCQSGLATVAAPGVFSFGNVHARRQAQAVGQDAHELHEDFARLHIAGRRVVVCFDSDIDSNPKVLLAAVRLGQVLQGAGADVFVTYVPGGGTKKAGMDDFLAALPEDVRNGENPLRVLVDGVRPFDPRSCVETFIEPRWSKWTSVEQDRELRRVALIAAETCEGVLLDGWCRRTAKLLDLTQAQVRSFLSKRERERVDAKEWVSSWLEANQVRYSMKTERMTLAGQEVTSVHIFQRMALDSQGSRGPAPQYISYALDLWMDAEKERAKQELRARLRHAPVKVDPLREWLHAVTGRDDDVDRAVMAHFVWQAKRKLFDLPVEHHLMPLLHGAQGCGKTTAIKKLLEPLEEFCDSPGDLQMLGDNRELFRLNRAYVLFFDEMARANKVDVDTLKNRITQDTLRWRALNMNRIAAGSNNATFIGATNTNVTDLIYDPTGIRRFYQVECQNPAAWETINSLDYEAVWRSIDESGPAPVLAVLGALKQRQEAMRPKDAVEEFLATRCEVGAGSWTSAAVLYENFKVFVAGDMRSDKWSSAKFGRRMRELLPDLVKTSNGVKYNVTFRGSDALLEAIDDAVANMPAANEPTQATNAA